MNEARHVENGLPCTKAELFERIDSEWKLLADVISGFDSERMQIQEFGGWSVKDILAHITAWERFMCSHYLQYRAAHEAFGLELKAFEALEEDGFNAILYERNRDRPLADVRSEFHAYHEQVRHDLREMSFEDMIGERLVGDRAGEPMLVAIAANTYEHYREHRKSIETLGDSGG